MPQMISQTYFISSERLLFKNITHDGYFQHSTWLYLAVPGFTWLYLTLPGYTWLYLVLPWSAMIYHSKDCHVLPLTGLTAFLYTGLNAQKI